MGWVLGAARQSNKINPSIFFAETQNIYTFAVG